MKKHLEYAQKLAARFTGKKQPGLVGSTTEIGAKLGLDVFAGVIQFSGLHARVRAICSPEALCVGLYSPSWREFEESYMTFEFTNEGNFHLLMKEGALAFITAGDREINARLLMPVSIIAWTIEISPGDLLADEPKFASILSGKTQ